MIYKAVSKGVAIKVSSTYPSIMFIMTFTMSLNSSLACGWRTISGIDRRASTVNNNLPDLSKA